MCQAQALQKTRGGFETLNAMGRLLTWEREALGAAAWFWFCLMCSWLGEADILLWVYKSLIGACERVLLLPRGIGEALAGSWPPAQGCRLLVLLHQTPKSKIWELS